VESDDFIRCVEVLADDAARAGRLAWSDVVRVTTARGLGDEVSHVAAALGDLDIEVTGAPVGLGAPRPESARLDVGTLPASMRSHVILTAEQEVVLGRRIQLGLRAAERAESEDRAPDPDESALIADGTVARDELITSNVRLVVSVVRRYAHNAGDLEFDDLVQEGVKGLHRAAVKFDPEKGYKYSTYANWWIRQHVERAIDDTGSTIRLPVHLCTEVRKVEHYARDFEVRNGRRATLQELAAGVGQDPARVQALLDWSMPVVRLDSPLNSDEGGFKTLGDVVLAATEPGPEELVADSLVAAKLRRRLASVLDPRSLRIVEGRFGFRGAEELTLESLGAEFSITRERVRQIENKILKVLREDGEVRALAETVLGRVA
jgi:RNA polymerase sigma factor (sigma-70 family)